MPLTSNSVRFECLELATTLVFAHLALFRIVGWWEPYEGWVSLNSIFLAEWLTSLTGAINISNIQFTLGLVRELFPCWCKLLAVTAPWGIELDKPSVFSLDRVVFLVDDEIIPALSIEFSRLDWLAFPLSKDEVVLSQHEASDKCASSLH